jgi:formiminotetrahydrofolate cyclodeaminase
MNKAAQALGRMAKGVPKTLTDEQRTFRAEQLVQARKKRHGKPKRVARRSNAALSEVADKTRPN